MTKLTATLPEWEEEEYELDLVDEAEWEDHVVFLTLQEAGLEEEDFDTVQAAQKVYFDEEY